MTPARLPQLLLAILVLSFAGMTSARADDVIAAQTIRNDLEIWLDWLENTHPDPGYTLDRPAFEHTVAGLRVLEGELTAQQAWLRLAALNPTFRDAHVGLALPSSGAQFPVPVRLRDGVLSIDETINSASTLQAGDRILAVNDRDVAPLIETVLPVLRGDTVQIRQRVFELKLADILAFWHGPAEAYVLTIQRGEAQLTIEAGANAGAATPADMFELAVSGNTAVLTIRSFQRSMEADFLDFLPRAFAEIAASDAQQLIIDLRENGGGARELSDPLLAYLTDQRHTSISAVTARITADNQARIPGSTIGEVVSLPFALWVEPPAGLDNRFDGEIAVLVGPATYSQAIAFASVVQDFSIGQIAGATTAGRVNQTGQVQAFTLPETGFEVRAPLYIFTRASGVAGDGGLVPDIEIDTDAENAIERLIEHLDAEG